MSRRGGPGPGEPGSIVAYDTRVGDVVLSRHAAERLEERDIDHSHLSYAVEEGRWEQQVDGAWHVTSEGVVAVVTDDGVVATAYRFGR